VYRFEDSPLRPHIPVLLAEVITALDPQAGDTILDGTLGRGGYAQAILGQYPEVSRYIGVDRDPEAIEFVKTQIDDSRFSALSGKFEDYQQLLELGDAVPNKIVLDLGVSSHQIDEPKRGFSFQQEGPLDMRMDYDSGWTAEDILRRKTEKELADIFYIFGEETAARHIAKFWVNERKTFKDWTTTGFAKFLHRIVPSGYNRKQLAVRRCFQALRIVVNDELGQLERTIPKMISSLPPKGRLVIVTFHSLEDRLVKHAFQSASSSNPSLGLQYSKKPMLPSDEEVKENPRSKSAKLRGFIRC